jgi:hypothetical protein
MTLVRSIVGCWPESALESSLAIRHANAFAITRSSIDWR